MKYISTRDSHTKKSFSEILLLGLSPEGGLVVPDSYPQVTQEDLIAWRTLDYPSLALQIMRLFVDDIQESDLKEIIDNTYRPSVFKNEEITPGSALERNLYLLHLANGPTYAFKDIAMQFLGQAFTYVLEKQGRNLNILGATSGDTGSAAEYAMRNKKAIQVFMLSPQGKMSPFQRAQMYALTDTNIHNIAIKGVFDDCQSIVKELQNDKPFKEYYHLGVVNSINWGRILAQIIYYFKAYFAISKNNKEKISFAVPSGNFGNVCAGHIARSMGLPIRHLIVATNENDVLVDFFQTGIYAPRDSDQVKKTSSPSMDIAKASNLERFIFDLLARDADRLQTAWQELDQTGRLDLSRYLDQIHHQFGFRSGKSTHQNRLDTIRTLYKEKKILVDPHTADGIKVAQDFQDEEGEPIVILETALPIKFEGVIKEALGDDFELPGKSEIEKLLAEKQYVTLLDNDPELVKRFISSVLS